MGKDQLNCNTSKGNTTPGAVMGKLTQTRSRTQQQQQQQQQQGASMHHSLTYLAASMFPLSQLPQLILINYTTQNNYITILPV
jgi:hypothetical protein